MGKRFQSRPPSRAVKLGLSAVLAVGLMPWGGVAVAAEEEADRRTPLRLLLRVFPVYMDGRRPIIRLMRMDILCMTKAETLSRSFILSVLAMPICRAILW